MDVASDAIGAIGNLMSTLYERDIDNIEKEQEANEEAYNADVERIEALAESGAISEEEAEVRKRAAEAETSRKNEELEKKKVQLQQKQAKWQKGVDIAQAGIATALAITRALPTSTCCNSRCNGSGTDSDYRSNTNSCIQGRY